MQSCTEHDKRKARCLHEKGQRLANKTSEDAVFVDLTDDSHDNTTIDLVPKAKRGKQSHVNENNQHKSLEINAPEAKQGNGHVPKKTKQRTEPKQLALKSESKEAASAAPPMLQKPLSKAAKAQYVYPQLKVAEKPYNLVRNPHLAKMLEDFKPAFINDKPSMNAYRVNQESESVHAHFKSTSKVGYAFSNFFRALVVLDVKDLSSKYNGIDGTYAFSSTEHAYQWACRVFPVDKSKSTLLSGRSAARRKQAFKSRNRESA